MKEVFHFTFRHDNLFKLLLFCVNVLVACKHSTDCRKMVEQSTICNVLSIFKTYHS